MSLFGSNQTAPTRLNGIRLSQAVLGTPLPIIIGQQRTSWQLLWYGDFKSAKAKQQGGKGMSKSGAQYVYSASVVGAVAMGDCTNFLGVWDSTGRYALDVNTESASSNPYTPANSPAYAQDHGASYASSYSFDADDYGSPGSTPFGGTQQVPLKYTSNGSPDQGYYTINGSGQYVFNSTDYSAGVSIYYSSYRYIIEENELAVVPPSGPYTVVVQYQSQWNSDEGVAYYPSGTAMTKVSGSPTVAGTYNPNGGHYEFAAADAGAGIVIDYSYKDTNTDNNAPSMINLTFFGGARGQEPWSYLASGHPGQDFGYSECAYVASSGLYLGYSPVLPQYNFEISGNYRFGGGIVDACPSDAIDGILTSDMFGVGFPAANVDGSLQGVARDFWCANNFFISALLQNQSSAMSVIGDWCEAGQVYLSWDEGLLKFLPLGDTTAVANGHVYTPPTQPVVDLDDDDFVVGENEDPITIEETPWQSRWNRTGIRWSVRANAYNEDTIEREDAASIRQYGLMVEQPKDCQFICRADSAQWAAAMRLQRLSAIFTKYSFVLKSNFAFLSPGDVVTVTDGQLGTGGTMFGRIPVRITKMTDDPAKGISVEAENFPWGVGAAILRNVQAQLPSDALDLANSTPDDTELLVVQVPAAAALMQGNMLYLFAAGKGSNWGGCEVYYSYDGTDYAFLTRIDTAGKMGTLASALPLHADPDTTDTLTVTMASPDAALVSVPDASADALVTLSALVSDTGMELVSYASASLVGPRQYALGYLRRGQYGTTPQSFSPGDDFVRLDEASYQEQYAQSYVGKTLHFKACSFNAYGNAEQPLSSVDALVVALTGTPGAYDLGTGASNVNVFKGAWSGTTSYVAGNEVVDAGDYWLCLVNNKDSEPALGNSNWQLVGSGSQFEGAWAGGTSYVQGQEVVYNSNLYVALLDNSGKEPDSNPSDWQLVGGGLSFMGGWNPGTAYVIGQMVSYGSSVWLALAASTDSPPAIGNSNWQVVGSQSEFTGPWSSSTGYVVGQEASYQGSVYLAVAASTNVVPTSDPTKWQNMTGISYAGAWSSTTGYAEGQEVSYGNNVYLCLNPNSDEEPDGSPADWLVVGPANASALPGSHVFLGAWNPATDYLTGQECTDGGNYWVCIFGNTNSEPSLTNANWQLMGPLSASSLAGSEVFLGPWNATTNYVPGNQVSANGNFWLCLVGNGPGSTVSDPPSPYWQLMGPTAAGTKVGVDTYIGPWSPTLNYDPGNEVSYGNEYYQALLANTNAEPDTSPTDWQDVGPVSSTAIAPIGPWNAALAYNVGDEVLYATSTGGAGSTSASPTAAASTHRPGLSQNSWANPANAEGSSAYATCTLYGSNGNVNQSDFLSLTDFAGLNAIPSDATITGIVVSLKHGRTSGTSAVYDDTVVLLGLVGLVANHAPAYAAANAWPGSPTAISYGTSADVWNVLPTVAQLQASGFGVKIACQCTQTPGTGATIELNSVVVTVHYTTVGAETTNYYKCAVANVGQEPDTSPTYWVCVGPATVDAVPDGKKYARTSSGALANGIPYTLLGPWAASTGYHVGEEVTYPATGPRNYYVCKTDNSDAAFDPSKWTLVGPDSLTSVSDDANYSKVVTGTNPVDLVQNPQFSASPTLPPVGWGPVSAYLVPTMEIDCQPSLSWDTTTPYAGMARSLVVTTTGYGGLVGQTFTVAPGEIYKLVAAAKTAETADIEAGIAYLDKDGNWMGYVGAIWSAPCDWTEFSYGEVAPAGSVYAIPWIWLVSAAAEFGLISCFRVASLDDEVSDGVNFSRVRTSALVNGVPFTYAGAWSPSPNYVVGQEVSYSGGYYVCTTNNQNQVPSSYPASWTLVGNSASAFLGAFSTGTAYVIGNQVTYASGYYICTTANGPGAWNGSDWQAISTPSTSDYLGAYSAGTAYSVGDQCSYLGCFWICIVASTGNVPVVGDSHWTLLGTSVILLGAYNAGTSYIPGHEVTGTDGNVYRCVANTVGHAPPNASYWALIGPSSLDSVSDGSTYSRVRGTGVTNGHVSRVSTDGVTSYPAKGVGDPQTISIDNEIADGTNYLRGTQFSGSAIVVDNPNFLAGTAGWTGRPAPYATTISADGTNPWTTNGKSLKVTTSSQYGAAVSVRQFKASPGDAFLFTCEQKSDGTFSISNYIQFLDGAGGFLGNFGTTPSTSSSWNQSSLTATAPAASAYFLVYLADRMDAAGGSHSAWITNVHLVRLASLDTEVNDGSVYARTKANGLSSGYVSKTGSSGSYTIKGVGDGNVLSIDSDVGDGSVYGRTRLGGLTGGYVSKTGSSGSYTIKGVGDGNVLSIDSDVGDGSVYARTKGSGLDSGFVSKTGTGGAYRIKGVGDSNVLSIDNDVGDGSTYGRTKLTGLTSGQVDLSKSGVIGKTFDNVADGSSRFAVINGAGFKGVSSVDGNSKALIDFTSAHSNKSLDNVPDGTSRFGVASVDANHKALIDFSSAHSNKSLDNVPDGSSRFGVASVDGNHRALVDFTQSGHIGKSLDNVGDGSSRYAASEPGADKTANHQAASIYGQGSLATKNTANLDSDVSDGSSYVRLAHVNADHTIRTTAACRTQGSMQPTTSTASASLLSDPTPGVVVYVVGGLIYFPDGSDDTVPSVDTLYTTWNGVRVSYPPSPPSGSTNYNHFGGNIVWDVINKAIRIQEYGPVETTDDPSNPWTAANKQTAFGDGYVAMCWGVDVTFSTSGTGGHGYGGGGGSNCPLQGTAIRPLGSPAFAHPFENSEWIEIESESGRKLTATPSHRLMTERGKVSLEDLVVGDLAITEGGSEKITRKERLRFRANATKVEMPQGHLYWSNGFLSHNIKTN